ncbi:Zinc transporter ZupT [Candidatus Norongarragalina meridionalis]|nr:Zinc transporter ZupT [Candidatus Norongarragalina meridionalis]
MDVFWEAIGAVFIVSLISFVGIASVMFKKKQQDELLFYMISFAAGSMVGAAFLDLLPEAVASAGAGILSWAIVGIGAFFVMEKFLHWYHCHKGHCDTHAFTTLSLVGDGVHNFIDGMIIAAAYMTSRDLGIVTTVAIIAHEIPQELGDYSVLIYGGMKRMKALAYNFLVALTAVAGALVVLLGMSNPETFSPYLLSFGAGGFLYISCSDLIPEMHKNIDAKKSLLQLLMFALGVLVIVGAAAVFGEA